jgi:hypothetical protein
MTAMFVSLPVTDLERAKAFYTALGFTINPLFTDHNAACVVVEEDHSAIMILTREFFQTFTDLPWRSSSTAAKRSMQRLQPAWPQAARSRGPRRTSASCTSEGSTIPTATASSSGGWTLRPQRRGPRRP